MTSNSTETVGWVSGPDGRGTLNLIWTCISTLFICLWTSWHLDYAADHDSSQKVFFHKLKWILLLLAFPEFGIGMAIGQLFKAREYSKHLQSKGYAQWTRLHCLFTLMGGIRIGNKQCKAYESREVPAWATRAPDSCWCNNVEIYGSDLTTLAKKSLLPHDPPVSKTDIKKRGKADALVKSIALLQVAWLVGQSIGRAVQHLAISELEIVTLSYVFYCAIIYLCWWQKPLDAMVPAYMEISHTEELDRHLETRSKGMPTTGKFGDSTSVPQVPGLKYEAAGAALISFAFAIFGGIHCLSWNSTFPTRIEKILWRASSIIMMVSYPLFYSAIELDDYVENYHWSLRVFMLLSFLIIPIYLSARLFVIIEAFMSLRSSPASLYDSPDWIKFIPHFS